MSDSVQPQRQQPSRLLRPWDSLQCMKVKSESEVAQSYLTLLATPWTAACQAPPSNGFSRQECWSGVPLPSPRLFLDVLFFLILVKYFLNFTLFLFFLYSDSVHAEQKCIFLSNLSDLTFTFHFHALEKETATHSSILAWRIPGTGKPGGLPSMGLHRVGHD